MVVWVGLGFNVAAEAACPWEGSASDFFRCLMGASEVVDTHTANVAELEARLDSLTDEMFLLEDTVAAQAATIEAFGGPVSFLDLTDIPASIVDGDDDTLGDMDCPAGEVALSLGDVWACGMASDVTAEEVGDLTSRLEALEALSGSGGGGVMYGDYAIYNSVDLAVLSGFTEVTGQLSISGAGLPHIDGLESLTSVGSMNISSNSALTNLDGLSGLMTAGSIAIDSNAALLNVDGLSSLVSVTGLLNINNNGLLTDLSGLGSLTEVGSLDVDNNDALTDFGMLSLTVVTDYMSISRHDALITMMGLDNLVSVANSMFIEDNSSLISLDGLSSLTSVGETLYINTNPSLLSLGGMESLTSVLEAYIYNNVSLCQSEADAIGGMASVYYSTYGNLDGC
jgi:hypothetical protein